MAEKFCCLGPIGGNNGNSAGGFREAVCVHTKRFTTSLPQQGVPARHPRVSHLAMRRAGSMLVALHL